MKKSYVIALVALSCTLLTVRLSHGVYAAQMRPGSAGRVKINFNDGWNFVRGEIGDIKPPAEERWSEVALPHFPRVTPLRHPWRIPDSQGINWYRKFFPLPASYKDKKIAIQFEGADQVSEVSVNKRLLTLHEGSYLPFSVDISKHAVYGDSANAIVVKVDNTENPSIPSYGRWISYGGIYRDVFMVITDKLHITDPVRADEVAGGGVFVRYPLVTDSLAILNVTAHLVNEYESTKTARLFTRLFDGDRQVIADSSNGISLMSGSDYTFEKVLRIPNPHLWSPDTPTLYTLVSQLCKDGAVCDEVRTRIGIRSIAFSRDGGFTLNGKRRIFMGANRVQEYPYVAWAFPDAAQRRDAVLLKEGGFQYVRSSHNPHDPSFLDACDELGLLVMDCIPGFQFIGDSLFQARSFKNMREMIRRDRNHPSVILWELSLNETEYDSSFAERAMRIGHEEYPGEMCYVAGWKFPDIYDVFLQASQHGAREYSGSAPLVISEYGHWDYGGGNSSSDVERRDGERAMLRQALNHQESLNLNRGIPFLCGDGLWVGIDFQCYPSGILDYFRLPKFSYYFYQSQRDPNHLIEGIDSGPMVYIANYWTESSPRTVIVYSNCQEVQLLLNGRSIAVRRADEEPNTDNLLHPPFTFIGLDWQPGVLEAVGYLDGKACAHFSRRTPEKAACLEMSFARSESESNNYDDMFFVYASLLDAYGTLTRENGLKVTFSVSGPVVLVSPPTVETEAGIAAALLRTNARPGTITVRADCNTLPGASGTIGQR